jgi:putative tryptophan/tyrosine transport system substrate-binding protein
MTDCRRRLLVLTIGAAFGASIRAMAQSGRVYRIGHLSGSGVQASKAFVTAFADGLRSLGLLENRDYVLEQRYGEGRVESLSVLAHELLALRPDVLLVSTTPASLAAKAATTSVPVVVVLVADPVGAGIVQTLSRPGGNITGITNIVAELGGKRLELLKELIPGASRVAVFINPDSQNAPLQMNQAELAARKLGIELGPVLYIRKAADLEQAFEAAAKGQAAAAIRMIDPLVFMLREQTAVLAAKYRLPVIYPSREDVLAGGLVAYGTNVPEQYRQAAAIVDKILKGAKPAELPVEQPTKFELVINLRAAKALGIAVPNGLLLRADEVIQ